MGYVLITGASDGIGKELAKEFASRSYNLVLTGRSASKTDKVKSEILSEYDIEIESCSLDLSSPDQTEKLIDFISKKNLNISIVVLNAGFYVKGDFQHTDIDEEQKLINLQCNHVVRLSKFFINQEHSYKEGIISVCSIGSFVPGPYNAVYCAVKAFLLSFSQAIAFELKPLGIQVSAVCPGGTDTNFQEFSKIPSSIISPVMTPKFVAKATIKGYFKKKTIIIPDFRYRIQIFLLRFVPRKIIAIAAASRVAPKRRKET